MATILLVTHASDRFHARSFLVQSLFEHWASAGHEVIVREGPRDLPAADVAFLHADGTEIPAEYAEALARYPVVVNGKTGDVTKRAISRNLVKSPTDFQGPVIVKTNRNSGGFPEAFHAKVALEERGEKSAPVRYMNDRYPVFESACLVPPHVFTDPDLVVERFLPERDERGYYVRYWVFLGDRERCSRYLEAQPIVKGDNAIERVPVPVPDELREWRRRLGFDYGKFDFVVRDGVPILLDANRTPTVPPNLAEAVRRGQGELARGIEAFLR
jgi:hypothetical protein